LIYLPAAMKRKYSVLQETSRVTLGIIAMFLFSCSGPATPEGHDRAKDTAQIVKRDNRKKPPSTYSDTVIIFDKSAVFYTPDSLQLKKIKEVNEKMIFESLMHDCYFQMRNARLVIQNYRPRVKIIDISKARWLVFIKADNSKAVIDLDTINDICGIYLFDGEKEPERIDMMNIDTELGFYFKK
jgi:hypothetical protein